MTETTQETQLDPYNIEDNFEEKPKKQYAYEVVPKGTRLMGLIVIKAFKKKTNYEGIKGTKNAYRIVFRDKEKPSAFLNVEPNASLKNNSDCYKLLEELSGRPFTGTELTGKKKEYATKEAALARMKEIVGGWYEVIVKHEPWKSDPTRFSPKGKNFEPQGKGQIDAVEYFKDIKVPELKAGTQPVEEEDDIPF